MTKLKLLCEKYNCNLETINLYNFDFSTREKYSPSEQALLKQILEGKRIDYFFTTVFVDGEEISGFPIPVLSVEERICSKLGIEYQPQEESFPSPNRKRHNIATEEISIQLITPDNFDDECELCLTHHPLIPNNYYSREQLERAKEGKIKQFLEKVFNSEGFVGFIAYVGNEPAGMIEAIPSEIARRIGFVCSGDKSSLVITCLTVRAEFQNCGIGRMLVKALVNKMENERWNQIEVFGTPGGESLWEKWQSIPFYKKLGFVNTGIKNKKGGELLVFKTEK